MKKFLNNLKPFFIYWSSVCISYIAYSMADFDFITGLTRNELARLFCYFSFAFFCLLFGRFSDLKESKIGMVILFIQFCFGGIVNIFSLPMPANIITFSNYIMIGGGYDAPFDSLFHYERGGLCSFLNFLFSIILPLVMIFIGYKLRTVKKKQSS